MSIEKQRLYNEIDTLPEELTNQVIDEENNKAFVVRIGHAFMDWEKCSN